MAQGAIRGIKYDENFAYILENENDFLYTEYKILQNQLGNIFIRCMQTRYNGRIQLYYLTGRYKKLIDVIDRLNESNFLHIVESLIYDVVEVKKNGFLTCCNINIFFDSIYVDLDTNNVCIVYLPVKQHIYSDTYTFESQFKNFLRAFIQKVSLPLSSDIMEFINALNVEKSNSQMLLSCIDKIISRRGGSQIFGSEDKKSYTTKLVASNQNVPAAYAPFEIVIDKREIIIGSDSKYASALIPFNKAVSRSHAKVMMLGDNYTITDLSSRNGTYVNNVKLYPDQEYPIRNGDIVRIANIDFKFMVK